MEPYTQDRWWTGDTVAVVTGSNKGIGKEIARLLAQQGVTTVLTSRQGKVDVPCMHVSIQRVH